MRKTLLLSSALLFALGAAGPVLGQERSDTRIQTETELRSQTQSTAGGDLRRDVEAAAEAAAETGESLARDLRSGLEEAAEEVEAALSPAEEGATAVQPEGTLLSSALQGRPVQNYEGQDVATLDSFVLTPDGEVSHAVVSFGGFLGFGKKQAMIAWSAFELGEDGGLRLPMAREQIAELPAFRTRAQAEAEMVEQTERLLDEQQSEAPAQQ